MGDIKQSNFLYDLEDLVVIAHPNDKNASLKGLTGRVTHRGYMDTVSPKGMIYPNLYAIYAPKEGLIPGIPQGWLTLYKPEKPKENLAELLLPLIDLDLTSPEEGDTA